MGPNDPKPRPEDPKPTPPTQPGEGGGGLGLNHRLPNPLPLRIEGNGLYHSTAFHNFDYAEQAMRGDLLSGEVEQLMLRAFPSYHYEVIDFFHSAGVRARCPGLEDVRHIRLRLD